MLYVITDKTKAITQLGPFLFPFIPPLAPSEEEGSVCCWRGDDHDGGVTMEGAMWILAFSLSVYPAGAISDGCLFTWAHWPDPYGSFWLSRQ